MLGRPAVTFLPLPVLILEKLVQNADAILAINSLGVVKADYIGSNIGFNESCQGIIGRVGCELVAMLNYGLNQWSLELFKDVEFCWLLWLL